MSARPLERLLEREPPVVGDCSALEVLVAYEHTLAQEMRHLPLHVITAVTVVTAVVVDGEAHLPLPRSVTRRREKVVT